MVPHRVRHPSNEIAEFPFLLLCLLTCLAIPLRLDRKCTRCEEDLTGVELFLACSSRDRVSDTVTY